MLKSLFHAIFQLYTHFDGLNGVPFSPLSFVRYCIHSIDRNQNKLLLICISNGFRWTHYAVSLEDVDLLAVRLQSSIDVQTEVCFGDARKLIKTITMLVAWSWAHYKEAGALNYNPVGMNIQRTVAQFISGIDDHRNTYAQTQSQLHKFKKHKKHF